MTREDLAIEFMETKMSVDELVEVYNTFSERNSWNRIFTCDEETIDILVPTESKTAYEIFSSFSETFSIDDKYIVFDDHDGRLCSTDEPDIEPSDIVDGFFASRWCCWNDTDFHGFCVEKMKTVRDHDFVEWFDYEICSDEEWDDLEDLDEMYQDYLEEEAEGNEDE